MWGSAEGKYSCFSNRNLHYSNFINWLLVYPNPSFEVYICSHLSPFLSILYSFYFLLFFFSDYSMHLRVFYCIQPCFTVLYLSVNHRTFVCRMSFMGELLHSTILFPSLLLPHAGWLFCLAKVNSVKPRLPVSNLCFIWHGWSKRWCGRQYVCYLHIKSILQGQKLAIRKQGWVRMHKNYPNVKWFLKLHQL